MLWLLLACNDNLLVQKGVGQEGETPSECWDGLDNDNDGFADCDDQDCLIYTECSSQPEDTGLDDTGEPEDTDTEETDTEDTNDTNDTSDTQVDPNDQDGDGFTPTDGDCDDTDANTNPESNDPTVDGKDQNCDGVDGPDLDSDGFADSTAGGTDCNDTDASINPNATDVPDDGIDQDCDGTDLTTTLQDDFTLAGEYVFTVPNGVTILTADVWGAGGAGGDQSGAKGGGGGFVGISFAVTGGEQLMLSVGEGGNSAGEGGGATFIYRGSDLIVVSGSGGGGASDGNSGNSWAGGAGGAGGSVAENGMDLLYHQQGTTYSYCSSATGGTGASQNAAGVGGLSIGTASYNGISHVCSGLNGASFQGGGTTGMATQCQTTGPYLWEANGGGSNGHAGAGGAGYFGGGGGGSVYTYCGAGGGGGSSWADPSVASVTYLDGSGQDQGNASQSNGAGYGGDRDYTGFLKEGADGRILLTW